MMVPLAAGLTACGETTHPLAVEPYDAASQVTFTGASKGAANKPLDPSEPIQLSATGKAGGRITDVIVADEQGRRIAGELVRGGAGWRSTGPLAANAGYTLHISTEDDAESPGRRTLSFRTGESKKKPLKVQLGPASGTYGVGQPVTAKLNKAVKDPAERAIVERGLHVETTPKIRGAWYWVDSKTLHYRPQAYWPSKTKIKVRTSLEGIKVREGLYASASKPVKLNIGSKVVAVTDASSHYMSFYKDGELINEIPVTTGKPGFETRNGKKVVLEKQYYVRMTGASIGVGGTGEDYNMDVYWATRVTWSGEYVHAAPWSVGNQGNSNASHGCTGMSTGNAQWFYDNVRAGDIVEVINSYGEDMDPFGNGFGDWNVSWKTWREGSILTAGTREGSSPSDAMRLRPRI